MEKSRVQVCYFITKGVWGGAQKYVYNLATSLPKDKFNVTVICGEGKVLKEKLESQGVGVFEIKNLKRDISVFNEIKSFIKVYRTIRKIRPDVLHLNSPKAGGLGAIIGRLLSIKKIIYTVHGFSWNEERTAIQKAVITVFTWFTILLCHKIITISTKEEEEAEKLFFVNKDKILMIRNGVEKIDFLTKEDARSLLEERMNRKIDDAFLIGSLCELNKNKGLEYIISALSKVSHNFMFVVLGGGELKNKLEDLIEKYKLKNKVFLLGFVPEASKYLKAFDLFTLTSVKEGLPYTILEAGLAEVPVIASRIGGIPDIIDDGKNGILLTKGKSGEITRAIEYLIDNPKIKDEFAEKLYRKVSDEFGLNQMLEKIIELYY